MSCTKNTSRCKKEHGEGGFLIVPECCREKIRELLYFTVELFEKHNIDYWLDYGTLLGAVREGGFFSHDEDADISTFVENREKVEGLKDEFLKKEYVVRLNHFKNKSGIQIRYSKENNLHIDIFFWYNFDGLLRRTSYVSGDENKGMDFPAEWVETTKDIKFENKLFRAPKNPERFCEFRYGTTWKTPMSPFKYNSQYKK